MERVEIKNHKQGWMGTECFIDGKKLRGVKSADFHVGVDSAPEFVFKTNGIPDIDVLAGVTINPSPTNIYEACGIIQGELREHGTFYDAFVASVQSVLSPKEKYVSDGCSTIELFDSDSHALAEEIVRRISGEE